MTPDILIVGAGPTGLTAAVELARRGILPTVIDRKAEPSPLSRAVGILPATMKILAPSGASETIRAEAVPLERAVFHSVDRPIGKIALHLPGDRDNHFFSLAQDRTEHHLRMAFERLGGAVRYGESFVDLSQDEDGVAVQIGDTERQFSHVIGADGVGSPVRRALGLDFKGFDLPETWSIADVDAEGWAGTREFHVYRLGRGRVVVVVPMEAARFRLVSNTPDSLVALPVPMNVTRIRRTDTFRISVRQVSRYVVGRVFLAGDAAHCHSPVGGRGMNLGIADAADLARRFAEGGLDDYHAARHGEGRAVIRLSERARRTLLSGNPLVAGLVRVGFALATHVPPLGRNATRTALGL